MSLSLKIYMDQMKKQVFSKIFTSDQFTYMHISFQNNGIFFW